MFKRAFLVNPAVAQSIAPYEALCRYLTILLKICDFVMPKSYFVVEGNQLTPSQVIQTPSRVFSTISAVPVNQRHWVFWCDTKLVVKRVVPIFSTSTKSQVDSSRCLSQIQSLLQIVLCASLRQPSHDISHTNKKSDKAIRVIGNRTHIGTKFPNAFSRTYYITATLPCWTLSWDTLIDPLTTAQRACDEKSVRHWNAGGTWKDTSISVECCIREVLRSIVSPCSRLSYDDCEPLTGFCTLLNVEWLAFRRQLTRILTSTGLKKYKRQ